jgi:hypothetical protein
MSGEGDGTGSRADDPCFVCPRCGNTGIRPAIRTASGAYCQCEACGHVWHLEGLPATPKSPLRRRKTDDPSV